MKLCVSPYFWTNKWNNRVQSASFLEQEMRPLALRQRNLSFQVDGWSEVKKGVSDPRVCCQLCQNHGGCKAWLWSEWSTEAHGMACILKGGQVGSEGPLKYLLSHHFRGYDTPRLVLWMFYGNDDLGIPSARPRSRANASKTAAWAVCPRLRPSRRLRWPWPRRKPCRAGDLKKPGETLAFSRMAVVGN